MNSRELLNALSVAERLKIRQGIAIHRKEDTRV